MASVELKSIEKTYPNGFNAVRSVDLAIRDGEFMVFVGPSGCAKSTLLRMIAGLESISGGELLIDGRCVNDLSAKQRGIAMVFQNYALYPHMSVYENLAFGLRLAGTPKAQLDARVRDAAGLLELLPLLDRYPKQLSGGQAQRVAVGRAIVKRPEVFLFDEPLSNLDAKLRASMRVRLTELHRTLRDGGKPSTVIYVTHDQVEAMTMGERICVLKDGTIQQVDTPRKLYEEPANAFVAGFIGSPEMNLHPVTVSRVSDQSFFSFGGLSLPLPVERALAFELPNDGLITMGIRPESITANTNGGGAVAVPGVLRFIENMGSEVFIHADFGGLPFTSRLAAGALGELAGKKRGDTHLFHWQMSACHAFNAHDGSSLLLGAA